MAAITTVDESTGSPDDIETIPAPKPPDRFVRHANLMSALTILSRLFGLVRDKACATYLGNKSTEWSAFWMGFQFPNLFRRIFGEGALTAIFVPLYTKVRVEQGQAAASRLASATCALLVLVLGGLTLLGEAVMIPIALSPSVSINGHLAALMIAVMLPYCVMVCLVALMGAMATVHEKFTAQSISPIILNFLMTAAVILAGFYFKLPKWERALCIAFAVLVAGLLQLLQMLPTLRAAGIHLWPTAATPSHPITLNDANPTDAGYFRNPAIRQLILSMLPMILGLSAVQLNTAMDTQIAWWLSPDGHKDLATFSFLGLTLHTPMESGAVGILSVAQRLYLLPVGIFGVSMAAAIFPAMSQAATENNIPELKRLLVAGLRKTLFISLPASAGMMLVARLLITLIYSAEGIERSVWAAIWFCAGIWAFEGQMVILRAYYAMHDRITPMKVAVSMVLLNFTLNCTLVWYLKEGGIALATTLSAIAQSAILLYLLRRRLGLLGLSALRTSILKGLLATTMMTLSTGTLLWAVTRLHPTPPVMDWTEKTLQWFVVLPAAVLTAALTYGLCAWILKMPELGDLPFIGRHFKKPHA